MDRGSDIQIDNQFWSRAPEHPRDVVMQILNSTSSVDLLVFTFLTLNTESVVP